jgi:hypothetical protein
VSAASERANLSDEVKDSVWSDTEEYYRDRLIETELLRRAVYIDNGDIAVPIGVFRRGGFVSVTHAAAASSVIARLQCRPGFPNLRHEYISPDNTPECGLITDQLCGPLWASPNGGGVRDYGGVGNTVHWGDPSPLGDDDVVRGRFYGFTKTAIDAWLTGTMDHGWVTWTPEHRNAA